MNETIFLAIQVCVLTVCVCMSVGALTFMAILIRWLMRELRENTGPRTYCYASTSSGSGPTHSVVWTPTTPNTDAPEPEPEPEPPVKLDTTVVVPQYHCGKCRKPMVMSGTGSDEHGNTFTYYECVCGQKHVVKSPKG